MPFPALFLGLILSTLYGTVFHYWRGGGAGRLLLYIFLSWAGFWLGQYLAIVNSWNFDQLGALHIGSATGGSVFLLLVGHWLSRGQAIERKS